MPALPSFKVAVTVLSYYAFADNIRLIISLLSRRTRVFFLLHKEMLKDIFINWYPQFLNTLEFGPGDEEFNFESLPKCLSGSKVIKLKAISFANRYGLHPYRVKKNDIAKTTKGVRLHFTNGLSTEPLPAN